MKKNLIYLIFPAFLYSCANQVPLEGGPKDEIAPVLEKSSPDTFALNFRGKKLTLTFDEFIVLKNPNKEVIVSPPVALQPTVQVTGKSVEVIFEDSLAANTTYTIQFGSAITDNNEGNVLLNYAFTFSTGNQLDSLEAFATLLDAFTLKPVTGVKWLLYENMKDSTPYQERPFYVGYGTDAGKATIRYMRPGVFHQFALIETNENFLYDAADEWIGFLDSTVVPGDSVVHRILMFHEKTDKNKLRNAKAVERGKIGFKFINDASTVKIRPLTDSLPPVAGHIEYLNETRDSAVYWHPPISKDTLFFEVQIADQPLDTVRVVYKRQASGKTGERKKAAKENPVVVEIKTNLAAKFDYYKPIELEFNRPVPGLDTNCIRLLQNGKPVSYTWQYSDSVQRKIRIQYTFKQGTDYVLRIQDSCFTDMQGIYNDSLVVPFKTTQEKDYTVLTLKASGVNASYQMIFQLLDKEDKVLQEKIVSPADQIYHVIYPNLLPGAYRVRLIYDANGNGKWDTGNYALRLQPEKVSYFPQNIEMKPSFDLDFDWDVNAPPKPEDPTKKGRN